MSSDTTARVLALWRKAEEFHRRGHLLRGAEIFGRAAAAVRALDSGPDSLVVVHLQQLQAQSMLNYAAVVDDATADARVLAAHRTDCVALLSAVVTALERRRVAGTLLEGKCSAAEEAWRVAHLRGLSFSPAEAAHVATLVGYDVYVRVADTITCMFLNAWYFAAECSATQFQAFAQHVVHAADLVQLPRSLDTMATSGEIDFARGMSAALAADDSGVPMVQRRGQLDARLVQLLMAAWQRLQRSGVLEARGILDERRRLEAETACDKLGAAVRSAMAAPGLRSCALEGCGAREAHPQHFKRCSACQAVVYCSKEHQLEAWPAHKAACKAARKAKAASSDGAACPGAAS